MKPIICKICENENYYYVNNFHRHLFSKHNMKSEEYYLKYINSDNKKSFHSIFGRYNNTKEQFNEYHTARARGVM